MTIQSTEFNTLVAQVGVEAEEGDYAAAVKRLIGFIDAYVVNQRADAVNEFKAQCRDQRLILVKAEGFEQLVRDLDRLPDGDMADHARNLKTNGLDAPEPNEGPEFTIKGDEDLDRLLNSTAALLSGRANQDVGMAWYDDLQAVLAKLSPTASAPPVVDPNEEIKVEGFDYPTTYGDLARLSVEKLWNRYVTGGPCPDAKAAFFVARAIPFVQVVALPDSAPTSEGAK